MGGSIDSALSQCGFVDPLWYSCGPAKVCGLGETLGSWILVLVISSTSPKYLLLSWVEGRTDPLSYLEPYDLPWPIRCEWEETWAASWPKTLRASMLPPPLPPAPRRYFFWHLLARLWMVKFPSTRLWQRTWRKASSHGGKTNIIMET